MERNYWIHRVCHIKRKNVQLIDGNTFSYMLLDADFIRVGDVPFCM